MEYVCKYYKFGYCKLKDQCENYHVKEAINQPLISEIKYLNNKKFVYKLTDIHFVPAHVDETQKANIHKAQMFAQARYQFEIFVQDNSILTTKRIFKNHQEFAILKHMESFKI